MQYNTYSNAYKRQTKYFLPERFIKGCDNNYIDYGYL